MSNPVVYEIVLTNSSFLSSLNETERATSRFEDTIKGLGEAVARLHLPMEEATRAFSETQAGFVGTGIEGQKLRDVFEGISEASTVLHLSADKFSNVTFALKEIGELGTLQSRQMRMLAFSLPGAMSLAAKSMHMNSQQFHEAMHKGEIDSASFLTNFSKTLKENFTPGLANASNSLISNMNDVKTSFTQLELKIGTDLEPTFITLMGTMKDAIKNFSDLYDKSKQLISVTLPKWLHDNKDGIEEITGAIVAGATARGAYLLWSEGTAMWSAIKAGLFVVETGILYGLGTAVEFVNAMFLASPIGWIVVGVSAATGAIIYSYNHFQKFREVLMGVWETVKEFGRIVGDVFGGLWHIIHGVFTLDASEIKLGNKESMDAMFQAGQRLSSAFTKGYDEGTSSWNDEGNKNLITGTSSNQSLVADATVATKTGGTDNTFKPQKEVATKATGAKNVMCDSPYFRREINIRS